MQRHISIEGSDGAGKGTQSKLLEDHFIQNGYSVTRVAFPRYTETLGGKMLFELIKGERSETYRFSELDPYAASLFYATDRRESRDYLKQLFTEFDIVIFDRYVESNLIHQGGKFRDADDRLRLAEFLLDLEYRHLELPRPDIVLYLSLPWKISVRRAAERAARLGDIPDAVERDEAYARNSSAAGEYFADQYGWTKINCMQKDRELGQQEVHEAILHAIGWKDGAKDSLA